MTSGPDLELRLEERYAVPPARVFEAWRDIEILRTWFGCGPGVLWEIHEWDCQPKGRLSVSLDIDKGKVEITGQFLVVEPPSRLSYSWAHGEVVDVHFDPDGDGTLLRLWHRGLTDPDDRQLRTGGWTFCLSSLSKAVGAA